MLPQRPESWPGLFESRLNTGDLESVMALYEPNARFVAKTGETVAGDGIRQALADMIDAQTRLQSRVVKSVTVDDIALLYTNFQGSSVDPSGKTIAIRYQAIEVLRRQSDGAWKLIVGDPNGRT